MYVAVALRTCIYKSWHHISYLQRIGYYVIIKVKKDPEEDAKQD